MKSVFAFFLIAALSGGCGILELKDKLLGSATDLIPWNFETSMGDQLLPSVLEPEMEITDPLVVKELEKLLAPLSSRISQPPIRIHISKSPELNAFAIPGGHLIFNRGMLLAADTPEEILGVASHEIAHATERHTMRSMIQGLGIYALITIFMGDVSGIAVVLIDQGRALIQSGFSRSQERSADEIGLDRLIEARINPTGMMRFFQRLEDGAKASGQGSTEISKFLSTHPLTAERIASIEARVNEVPKAERDAWKPVSFDLRSFQSSLKASE